MKKTSRRKAAPRKKTAFRKPARKVARKTARKPVRKAARRIVKVAPKRAVKKTVGKKAATKTVARTGRAKQWSADEVRALRTMYTGTATTVIAKKLRRSLSSVRSKAVALSLKKGAMKKAAARKSPRRRR